MSTDEMKTKFPNLPEVTLYAVTVATRSHTRFVSHHRTNEGARRAADRYNETVPRGTRAEVSGIRVYE